MHHLYGVHQRGQRVDYLLGSSLVQRLDEFLQSRQILHVVLGFIQLVSQLQVQSVVLLDRVVDLFVSVGLLLLVLLHQVLLNCQKVLSLQLLVPVSDVLHPLSPVYQFGRRTCVLSVFSLFGVVVQHFLDLSNPFSELLFVVVCSLRIGFQLFQIIFVQFKQFNSRGH